MSYQKQKFLLIITLLSLVPLGYKASRQTVQITFFHNPQCGTSNEQKEILDQMKFERVTIKEVKIHIYPEDPEDPEWVKELRKRYDVRGAPVLLIDNQTVRGLKQRETLERIICDRFIIPPGECLGRF